MKIFLIALILSITNQFAIGHPGRTDANGGHYNRKTGEYHYHSGPKKHAPEKSAEIKTSESSSELESQRQQS
jgi:hypothetical protein